MPQTPEPRGASPDLMPFLRWVRETLVGMISEQQRQSRSDTNTNSSQNSTMSVLVERLGTVEAIMATIGSTLTFDASQVVSGIFATARIPSLDASKITTGTITNAVSTPGDVTAVGYGTFNAAWSYNVSAVTRLAVWMDSSGKLGQTSSSEIYKKNIRDFVPNENAVRLLRVRSFNWDPSYAATDGHTEVGLIAQQLHNLGLRWLVAYDEAGNPIAIHYDRLGVALLPLVQRMADDIDHLTGEVSSLTDRLEAMELRLSALEGSH